jgi:ACR3 family arsenite transporter
LLLMDDTPATLTHTDAVRALSALAHDARLAVFKLLVQAGPEGLAAGVLAEQLAIAPSALSFHLKELTHAGLLVQRPDGRRLMYSAHFGTMNSLLGHLTENCCQGVPCKADAPVCAVRPQPDAGGETLLAAENGHNATIQGIHLSAQCETTAKLASGAPMSVFERYLTVWVFLCIVAGIALGQVLPGVFQAIGRMEVAQVNLPVGLLIWVMVIPMLVKVDFGALGQVRQHMRGIGVTLFVNWLVKPFSMAFLAWIFVRHVFAGWLPADQLDSYVAGLILLAAAPCTAMVFVWSRLTGGDPLFTLSQVALNDSIMVVAFAPLVGLLLGMSAIIVPWATLVTSVVLYIVIPVALAQWLRKALLQKGQSAFDAAMERLGPFSIAALLVTLVLLFAFQGEAILKQPLVIAMLAVPILIQVVFNSGLAYWLNRAVGEKHNVACPSALIGASNFFELAVAAAISLFGFNSGAALATVVGVLIEVPVMLAVVAVVNRSKGWYERGMARI